MKASFSPSPKELSGNSLVGATPGLYKSLESTNYYVIKKSSADKSSCMGFYILTGPTGFSDWLDANKFVDQYIKVSGTITLDFN